MLVNVQNVCLLSEVIRPHGAPCSCVLLFLIPAPNMSSHPQRETQRTHSSSGSAWLLLAPGLSPPTSSTTGFFFFFFWSPLPSFVMSMPSRARRSLRSSIRSARLTDASPRRQPRCSARQTYASFSSPSSCSSCASGSSASTDNWRRRGWGRLRFLIMVVSTGVTIQVTACSDFGQYGRSHNQNG